MKNEYFCAYIAGKWVKGEQYFKSSNPSTNETLGFFPKCTKKQIISAIEEAYKAQKKWRNVPAPKRAQILFKSSQIMKEEKERLSRILTKEMGKVLKEARGDVQEAIDIFEYMAGEGRRLFGNTTTSELEDKFCMTIRRPIGVVGIISPWNFPIAVPSWKIAPALICGNSIVFKPSSKTPLCALEMIKILIRAGVPEGVINLVFGEGEEVGGEIVKNEKVGAISFTGSKETGEWILKNAGVKKVGLELGGKNPIIVMEDADLENAAEGIVWGAFGTSGQRCTATSRVIAHKKIKKKLIEILLEKTKKIRIGDGLDEKNQMGPLIDISAVERVEKYIQIGENEEAKCILKGKRVGSKGFFFEPTIFDEVKPQMRIAKEEIFGPVLSILEFEKIEDAIEIANSVEYGLSSAIYTKDMKAAFYAIKNIESGITYINSSTIGAETHLPFGGVKKTGNTREAGIMGIDEFSEIKTVYIDYSGKLQKAQIDS